MRVIHGLSLCMSVLRLLQPVSATTSSGADDEIPILGLGGVRPIGSRPAPGPVPAPSPSSTDAPVSSYYGDDYSFYSYHDQQVEQVWITRANTLSQIERRIRINAAFAPQQGSVFQCPKGGSVLGNLVYVRLCTARFLTTETTL